MNDGDSQFETLMRQAIDLAEKGRGHVEPNPLVGCLIIKDNEIIGQGYHEKFGGPHAEVNALNHCSESPEGAIAIVTLEPCCHYGKTPPCVDALIDAKIQKVIIGLKDPNPQVDGGGIAKLAEAGIKVSSGLLSEAVATQNAAFIKSIKTGMPWVIAKYAMTLDGKIATQTGDSKWISNDACRQQVHLQRSRIDAIVVGSETVKQDDPALTARPAESESAGPRNPLRVILDSKASLSATSQVVVTARETPTLVVVDTNLSDPSKLNELKQAGVEILSTDEGYVNRINRLLLELGSRKMQNVVVEGGGGVHGEFLQADQVDEINLYLAPRLIGSGRQPFRFPELEKVADGRSLEFVEIRELGGNLFIRALLKK